MRVDFVEGRILGSLIEKQLTTPQQYPLTLSALVLACNQISNRDPATSLDEPTVQGSLGTLKEKGLVRYVLPSHGRSAVRFRQVLDERLALDERQMALVAVLLLRGSQTLGELRARTERLARFDSPEEVERDLEGLTRGEEPFVARLGRQPGHREERWGHLLGDGSWRTAATPEPGPPPSAIGRVSSASADGEPEYVRPEAPDDDGLRDEVASLRNDLEVLRAEIDLLKKALGM